MDKIAPRIGGPLEAGTVMSVNGIRPKVNGNVDLPIGLTHVNGQKAPPDIQAMDNPDPSLGASVRGSKDWKSIQPLDEGEF